MSQMRNAVLITLGLLLNHACVQPSVARPAPPDQGEPLSAAVPESNPQANSITDHPGDPRASHTFTDSVDPAKLEVRDPSLPQATRVQNETLLDHKYFMVSYNSKELLPNWVSHRIYVKNLNANTAERQDQFFPDPLLLLLKIKALTEKAFRGSSYDRGHMAPSADFAFDQVANNETFVMSNMAPQSATLNRVAWSDLEQRIRRWARCEGDLRVVTGPVLEEGMGHLPSGVAVPKRFFKVIMDETPPRKAVGFVYSQDDATDVYAERATDINTIEKLTGYNFFADEDNADIESRFDLKDWHENPCPRTRASR